MDNQKQSFSWLSLLQIIMIVLKVTKLTDISWWWIFAPTIFGVIIFLTAIIGAIFWYMLNKSKK